MIIVTGDGGMSTTECIANGLPEPSSLTVSYRGVKIWGYATRSPARRPDSNFKRSLNEQVASPFFDVTAATVLRANFEVSCG